MFFYFNSKDKKKQQLLKTRCALGPKHNQQQQQLANREKRVSNEICIRNDVFDAVEREREGPKKYIKKPLIKKKAKKVLIFPFLCAFFFGNRPNERDKKFLSANKLTNDTKTTHASKTPKISRQSK